MSQDDVSKKSSVVREFIYLDRPKLESYLSQIDSGLSLLFNTIQDEYNRTEVEPSVREVINTSVARAVAGGNVPFLGKAEGEFKHERVAKTNSGGTRTQTTSDVSLSKLSVLHHKTFDLVMDELGDRLTTVKGRIYLIAMDSIMGLMEDLGESALGANLPQAQRGFAAIGRLGVSNIAYCEGHGVVTSAFMSNENFTINQAIFPYVYGVPTDEPFTLVGIKAKHKDALPNVVPKGVGLASAGQLTGALGKFGKVIDDVFGTVQRLYPIALYRDL